MKNLRPYNKQALGPQVSSMGRASSAPQNIAYFELEEVSQEREYDFACHIKQSTPSRGGTRAKVATYGIAIPLVCATSLYLTLWLA